MLSGFRTLTAALQGGTTDDGWKCLCDFGTTTKNLCVVHCEYQTSPTNNILL